MKSPIKLLSDYIIEPVYNFHKNFIGKDARHRYLQGFANTIFKLSKDLPLIMLGCNAIAIASSHIAQYRGLKKSNRENKEYLMKQEKIEGVADIALNTLPIFALKNGLTRKLESGAWATESSRNNLMYVIAPTAGINLSELYSTDHLTSGKESAKNLWNSTKLFLRRKKLIPEKLMGKFTFVEKDLNKRIPKGSIEEIAMKFDGIRKRNFDGFYNGSAVDEICGQFRGMEMMLAIGYGILASNIIMPIIKNVVTNEMAKKERKKNYNSKESIERRERYGSLQLDTKTLEKSTLKLSPSTTYNNTPTKPAIFSTFNGNSSQSTGLRI